MIKIGKHILCNNVILAPMAGVTDRPFRQLCKKLRAGMAVSEMVGSTSLLRGSKKTLRRANHEGETKPCSVQIVGADPKMLAEAAKINQDMGADIIDINMGCPAKKVCNMLSGSALLRDEELVANILKEVVNAVEIPVTLKIRTGWDKENKNAISIAKIAESSGIQLLTIHGRTRNCFFKGNAEYDTIRDVKQAVNIPIIANGDIDTPEKAKQVLAITQADGVMIGRAAQGDPWIFAKILNFLSNQDAPPNPSIVDIKTTIFEHLENLYAFYGEQSGVRVARKHISWYIKSYPNSAKFRHNFNQLLTVGEQQQSLHEFFASIE